MRKQETTNPPDGYLLGVTILLVAIGVLLVFDASYAKSADLRSYGYDARFFAKKQVVWAVIGLAAMFGVTTISLKRLRSATTVLLGAVCIMLVAVLIPGIGHKVNGARSWFRIGPVSIEPLEFAKPVIALFLAAALSRTRVFAKGAPRRWVVPLLVVGIMVVLIVCEHDLGTGTLLAASIFTIFALAGARRWPMVVAGLGGFAVVVVLMFLLPHCKPRVDAWRDPWTFRTGRGFQIVQSLSGLAKGGVVGVGLCEGRMKTYVPAASASTDYIFATIGEETGLVGGLTLLFLFGVFAYRGVDIARRCRDPYAALLALGVTSMFGIQVLINMAVVTNTIPSAGMPLPFISYGGTSLVMYLVEVGILLSVSRQVDVVLEDKDKYEDSNNRRRDRRSHLSGHQRSSGASRRGPRRRTTVRR